MMAADSSCTVEPMPKLSIIIVNFNTRQLLVGCLRSIYQFAPRVPFDVIVVDNASTDKSVEAIRAEFPGVKLIVNQSNLGFAAANNQGLKQATGDYVMLLNADTKVTEGAIDTLIEFLRDNPDIAAVGPMLLNDDGSFQRSYFQFPNAAKVFVHILGVDQVVERILRWPLFKPLLVRVPILNLYQDFSENRAHRVPYILFACILLRREIFDKVGLLDEALFFFHEDCEFGYRLAKKGEAIYWVPFSKVFHLGGGSSRLLTRVAFQQYYRSLLYVFDKHESKVAQLAVRIAIFVGFLIRATLTAFGAYRQLKIPSTYRDSKPTSSQAFAALTNRVNFYISMAMLAIKPKEGRA
jgi:GT2 family glycosyltransferase